MTDVQFNGVFHSLAHWFRRPTEEEDQILRESIAKNGLLTPGVLLAHDVGEWEAGTGLDGISRHAACTDLGIEMLWDAIGFSDEAALVEFILGANLARRHLSVDDRAFIAAKVAEEYQKEYVEARKGKRLVLSPSAPKGAPSTDGERNRDRERDSTNKAARRLGVAPGRAKRAKSVMAEADLLDKVRRGDMTIGEAYRESTRRSRERRDAERAAKVALGIPVKVAAAVQKFNAVNEYIGWAAWSWNPITGCEHGCPYCYARDMAERFQSRGVPGYEQGFVPVFHPNRLDAPANTKMPRTADPTDPRWKRVFVCSMADMFGKWVPQDWINQIFASCAANPQWHYMFLTKFPSRYKKLTFPANAWAGASIDTQRRVTPTVEAMRDVQADIRWLSLEPLLEPLVFNDLSMFDLVVIGSQTAVRPTKQFPQGMKEFAPPIDWVIDIVTQARAAGCAVYLKDNLLGRLSGQHPGMQLPQELPTPKNRSGKH